MVDLPLKIFAKSEASAEIALVAQIAKVADCAAPFTGYIKKGIYYYKTRQKGNAVNVNAKHLNNLFAEELRKYEYDKKLSDKLRQEITWLVNERLKGRIEEQRRLKKQLTELNDKIEKLELRFVNDEIPKELFEKYQSKFKQEKEQLEKKTSDTSFDSSNLEKVIDKGLRIAENASELWLNRSFDDKQQLQQLIFPEGILYNKEKDRVRTIRTNQLFEPIPQLVRFLEGKEKSHPFKDGSKSRLVDQMRIEL